MNQHAPFLHPYDGMIPLSVAGYILGTVLLLVHLYALVKRQQVQAFLLASPRNHCWLRFCWPAACSGSFCWWLPKDWAC